MILNENNKNNLFNKPGMVKRGFNQKPEDIIDSMNAQKPKHEDFKMGKAPHYQGTPSGQNIDMHKQIENMNNLQRTNKNNFK